MDATRKVVVESMVVRNALSGISRQVRLLSGVAALLVHFSAYLLEARAYRGWQRFFRDHVRRTEGHNLAEPLITE